MHVNSSGPLGSSPTFKFPALSDKVRLAHVRWRQSRVLMKFEVVADVFPLNPSSCRPSTQSREVLSSRPAFLLAITHTTPFLQFTHTYLSAHLPPEPTTASHQERKSSRIRTISCSRDLLDPRPCSEYCHRLVTSPLP